MGAPSIPGELFVISAPSGVGKTTLIRSMLAGWPQMRFSVSCTTRSPRTGEVAGRDYHFIGEGEFKAGIESGRFVEWAEVHGKYYGTDGDQIARWLEAGDDVLLDIDVQGARQVRCVYPRAHTVFILPPSLEVLALRLEGRGTESREQLDRRLEAARLEILEAPWYDYIVMNDRLEEAIADLQGIVRACRCHHTASAPRYGEFLRNARRSAP